MFFSLGWCFRAAWPLKMKSCPSFLTEIVKNYPTIELAFILELAAFSAY